MTDAMALSDWVKQQKGEVQFVFGERRPESIVFVDTESLRVYMYTLERDSLYDEKAAELFRDRWAKLEVHFDE